MNTYRIPDDVRWLEENVNLTHRKFYSMTRCPTKERTIGIVVILQPMRMKNVILKAVVESLVLNVMEILFNDISLKIIITTFRTIPTSFRNNHERRV